MFVKVEVVFFLKDMYEREARKKGEKKSLHFTVPMAQRKGVLDFSFSGLKAQVSRFVDAYPPASLAEAGKIAAAFQFSAIEHVAQQLKKGLARLRAEDGEHSRPVVVSGGVAANKALRRRLRFVEGANLFVPPALLCQDNGIMIAWTGLLMREFGIKDESCEDLWYDPSWKLGPEQGFKQRKGVLNDHAPSVDVPLLQQKISEKTI
jgi:tRNA A37 threonylcarbamoyltransferase TsaD